MLTLYFIAPLLQYKEWCNYVNYLLNKDFLHITRVTLQNQERKHIEQCLCWNCFKIFQDTRGQVLWPYFVATPLRVRFDISKVPSKVVLLTPLVVKDTGFVSAKALFTSSVLVNQHFLKSSGKEGIVMWPSITTLSRANHCVHEVSGQTAGITVSSTSSPAFNL